jgi:hypothetical protein
MTSRATIASSVASLENFTFHGHTLWDVCRYTHFEIPLSSGRRTLSTTEVQLAATSQGTDSSRRRCGGAVRFHRASGLSSCRTHHGIVTSTRVRGALPPIVPIPQTAWRRRHGRSLFDIR